MNSYLNLLACINNPKNKFKNYQPKSHNLLLFIFNPQNPYLLNCSVFFDAYFALYYVLSHHPTRNRTSQMMIFLIFFDVFVVVFPKIVLIFLLYVDFLRHLNLLKSCLKTSLNSNLMQSHHF